MSEQPLISQRDLRLRSKEVMDAVERGESFTVTRDGREIGELVPLRRRQRFLPRADFVHGSRIVVDLDPDAFRHDLDTVIDDSVHDPYGR